jgi:hypothetical protein
MLMSSITLDAAMTASAVLDRLARNGFWRDPADPAAKAWIAEYAKRTGLSVDEAARRLARDAWRVGAAIRRQWYANVLWYARPLEEVLYRCSNAPPDEPLLYVLNLHETDSQPPITATDETPAAEGVVFAGETPVGVNVNLPMAAARPPSRSIRDSGSAPPPSVPHRTSRSAGARCGRAPRDQATRKSARGRGSARPGRAGAQAVPGRRRARGAQQRGVAGGRSLKVPASVKSVDVSIELIAERRCAGRLDQTLEVVSRTDRKQRDVPTGRPRSRRTGAGAPDDARSALRARRYRVRHRFARPRDRQIRCTGRRAPARTRHAVDRAAAERLADHFAA